MGPHFSVFPTYRAGGVEDAKGRAAKGRAAKGRTAKGRAANARAGSF